MLAQLIVKHALSNAERREELRAISVGKGETHLMEHCGHLVREPRSPCDAQSASPPQALSPSSWGGSIDDEQTNADSTLNLDTDDTSNTIRYALLNLPAVGQLLD
jgi:hypothetical protein